MMPASPRMVATFGVRGKAQNLETRLPFAMLFWFDGRSRIRVSPTRDLGSSSSRECEVDSIASVGVPSRSVFLPTMPQHGLGERECSLARACCDLPDAQSPFSLAVASFPHKTLPFPHGEPLYVDES